MIYGKTNLRKAIHKILAVFIAISIILPLFPAGTLSEESEKLQQLVPGVEYTKSDTVTYTYQFTPEKTAYYYMDYKTESGGLFYSFFDPDMNIYYFIEYGQGHKYHSGTTYEISVSDYYIGTFTLKEAGEVQSADMTDEYYGYVGKTGVLYLKLSPKNTFEDFIWTSSNEDVVEISYSKGFSYSTANMKFKSEGEAVITATSENGITLSCNVHVIEPIQIEEDTEITVQLMDDFYIREGFVGVFTPNETGEYTFREEGVSDGYLHVEKCDTSESLNCESFTWERQVYSLEAGKQYKVSYYLEDEGYWFGNYPEVKMTVSKSVEAESIDINTISSGYIGQRLRLDATISPWNSRVQTVDWSSSDESVAVIDWCSYKSAEVELVGCGTAEIKASVPGGPEESFIIEVREKVVDQISEGELKEIQPEDWEGEVVYSFIPDTGGDYMLCADSSGADYWVTCTIMDSNWNTINVFSIGGTSHRYYFDDGETYYICLNNDNTYDIEQPIVFFLEKGLKATAITVISHPDNPDYIKGTSEFDFSGLSIEIEWEDGNSGVFNYPYDRGYECVNGGCTFDYSGGEIEFDCTSVESDGTLKVLYDDLETEFELNVAENPIESITLVSSPAQKYVYGAQPYCWEYDDFFVLGHLNLCGLTVDINYNDGTSERFTAEDGSPSLNGHGFIYDVYSDGEPDELIPKGTFPVSIKYMGHQIDFSVDVIEAPDRIEINQAPAKEYIYGVDTWEDDDGTVYFYPVDLSGLVFSVYYSDGTNKQIEVEDKEYYEWDRDSISDREVTICFYEDKIDGYNFYIRYNLSDLQIGEMDVTFEYLGLTDMYAVRLVENPVSSIEIERGPDASEFSKYVIPDLTGLEIKVNYKDGHSETIIANESNYDFFTQTISFDKGSIEYLKDENIVRFGNVSASLADVVIFDERDIAEVLLPDTDDVSFEWYDFEAGAVIGTVYPNGERHDYLIIDSKEDHEDVWYDEEIGKECIGRSGNIHTNRGIVPYCVWKADDEANIYVYIFGTDVLVEQMADILYGDADNDGTVSIKDVILVRKYLANYDYDAETSSVEIGDGADANGDGEISIKDAVLIRKYLANYDYDTGESSVVLGP